ncbi:MAG: S41 family peptidase [Planctomycetota bacterium]
MRLLARLRDGHARVNPTSKGERIRLDDGKRDVSAGMFWCRAGEHVLVKASWGKTAELGIKPGMEVVRVDGKPVAKWLDERISSLADLRSFSSAQHALFAACHFGLADDPGTRRTLELLDAAGKKFERTLNYASNQPPPVGPAVMPSGVETRGDLDVGKLASGNGYIHLRRSPDDLIAQIDDALERLGAVPGLVLDFRGNSGGGLDHDAFMGRFVPKGEKLATYASAGEHPYGGPIVVIVDGTVVSAGETLSGIFKEDGRGYMIGESPTAGMSSHKTTIELPSGLFTLYVSVASNKARFNGGRGIEGIGVIPHEIIAFERADLAAGVDTLIRRADELLAHFPGDQVRYRAR